MTDLEAMTRATLLRAAEIIEDHAEFEFHYRGAEVCKEYIDIAKSLREMADKEQA